MSKGPQCKVCGYIHPGFNLGSWQDANGSTVVNVELKHGQVEGLIAQAILHFWQWKAEGELPHMRSSEGYRERGKGKKGKETQLYYDGYHESIKYLGGHVYSFRIQTGDSPEGDTWMQGEVEFYHPGNMKITKMGYTYQ